MFDDDSQTDKSTENQQNNGSQDSSSFGLGGTPTPPTDPLDSGLPTSPTAPSDPTDPIDSPSDPLVDDEPSVPSSPANDDLAAGSDFSGNSDLNNIKNQALSQLSPLVHKLDQTPEEKYKTLMMMIQASDNQDLIPEAYEAAQKIEDEKIKAQALLNIVNEINYFNQKG